MIKCVIYSYKNPGPPKRSKKKFVVCIIMKLLRHINKQSSMVTMRHY